MKKIFHYIGNTAVVLSLLILYMALIFWKIHGGIVEDVIISSVSATILTIFIYKKIENKFLK